MLVICWVLVIILLRILIIEVHLEPPILPIPTPTNTFFYVKSFLTKNTEADRWRNYCAISTETIPSRSSTAATRRINDSL